MATYTEATHLYNNNLLGWASGASLEPLVFPYSKFDFGIKWRGADAALNIWTTNDTDTETGPPRVGLDTTVYPNAATGVEGFAPDKANCPLYVEWDFGTLPGTIKEKFYSFTTLMETIDNVDPGYNITPFSLPVDNGRPGPRYTFMCSGSEYRLLRSSAPNRPLVVAAPPEGFPFPLYLSMFAPNLVAVIGSTAGAILRPTTIYSKAQQVEDFGSAQTSLHLRIYQVGLTINGVPLDVDIP